MKKVIIAGAASAALAAMPIMGAFAATSVVDTINVTVSDSCTFNRTAGEGTYSTTLLPNATSENFGSSTFTAACNFGEEGKKVEVTAAFGALTSGANSIPYGSAAVEAGTAGWTASKGTLSADAVFIANNAKLIDVANATENQVATVWYSVATAANQAAGTYKGYATYTLAEN